MHAKTSELEKHLGMQQKLEFEIQQLKASLHVLESVEDDEEEEDSEFVNKLDTLQNNLRDKELLIEELETLIQTLTVKERKMNDELQEARKALINVSDFFFIFQLNHLLNPFGRLY